MSKFVKVMFGNKGANFEYKIGEINVANNWNPSAKNGKDFGGFNYADENCIIRWLHRGNIIYDVEVPDDADVFELCCDDQKKVDEYREMFDIKQRVKDGKISEQDYQFLINKIGINDDYLQSLIKKMFLAKGVFDDGNQTKIEKNLVSKR